MNSCFKGFANTPKESLDEYKMKNTSTFIPKNTTLTNKRFHENVQEFKHAKGDFY